jgi:ATP-dependent DNA helicase RecG
MAPERAPEAVAQRLGLAGAGDLILHLPLRYQDETRLTPLAEVRPGETVQVEGWVRHAEIQNRPRRQLVVEIGDTLGPGGIASGTLFFRLLHFYPSQISQLKPGARVRLLGEARPGFFGAEMVHPQLRVVRDDTPLPDTLTPVYPAVAGLSQHAIRKAVAAALRASDLEDSLPQPLAARLGLPSFRAALERLHHPPPDVVPSRLERQDDPAWRRVKFDELLAQQLSLRLAARQRHGLAARPLVDDGGLGERLLAALPFRLTAAQRRALDEIRRDLARPHPMNRLLQGDVGSGKTLVAALATLPALAAGGQAAVMAPTEILAEQLYLKFREWLEPLGLPVVWLSAATKGQARRRSLEALVDGRARVAVGTHALFQSGVGFHRLNLAIVDEQHRFGVAQRLALREKGHSPSPAGGGAGGEGVSLPHRNPNIPIEILDFARSLRKRQTDAEQLIWGLLRAHRLGGAKFQRQKPLGPYFLDFYCHDAKLAIELDGGQHAATSIEDKERDAWLAREGIRVMRFWNNEVLEQTEDVLRAIWESLHESPSPPPPEGEGSMPHLLMMSATPIPRSLAMSYYADLDVSVIDALPPGRSPIVTRLISHGRRDEVVGRLRDYCRSGAQAYWVCPLVEESEKLQLRAAQESHAELAALLPELAIGLVHGRMKAEEKAAVMADFKAGRLNLLVATTVIEVGVDVPNAALMVIEHAERYGLAQLHQLRGRVGRGARESTCLLMFGEPLSESAKQRLRILKENTDGFAIAREDLKLRGPGEFLGARQSGQQILRFADLDTDLDLLEAARNMAEELIDRHPDIVTRHLDRWLPRGLDYLRA